ncbi:MAG: XdhC family protein [Alphaproteobacteria bacterium]
MKQSILQLLLKARADKRPAALLTALDDGAQSLVVDGAATGTLPLTAELDRSVADATRDDRSRPVESQVGRVFVHVFNPPLRLVIVGAVHIAQPLAPMAALAGYDVTVIDPRRAFASDDRFPAVTVRRDWPDEGLAALAPDHRTAVVTLTHDPKLDDPALDVALKTDAFYIAALGSKKTHAARLDRLAALSHGPDALARIHGPAGLALGAVSPAEIAIAVMAQMTQALRRRPKAREAAA